MPGKKEVSIREGMPAAVDTPRLTSSISKKHKYMSFYLNESMEGQMQTSNASGCDGSDCNYYSCTVLKNCLYFFGGVSKAGKATNRTFVFHLQKRKWYTPEQLGSVPSRRRAVATAVADNRRIILHGGYDGAAFFKDCFMQLAANLDSFSNPVVRWEKIPQTGDIPHGRSSHSLVLSQDTLYLFGGTSKVELFEGLHAMNINEYAWKTVKTHGKGPSGRINASLVAVNGSLFCFGGLGKQATLHDMYKFEIATSNWTQILVDDAKIPKNSAPRGCYDMDSDSIYFFCGGPGMLSYVNIFNVSSEKWSAPVNVSEHLIQKSSSKSGGKEPNGEGVMTLCDFDNSTSMDQIGYVRLYSSGSEESGSSTNLNFEPFYNDEKTADIVVKVNNETIYAHKILLLMQSPFLSEVIKSSGSSSSGLTELVVDNAKYSVKTVQTAVKYCYEPAISASVTDTDLFTLVQFAMEYGFTSLKKRCEEMLSNRINKSNVCDLLKSAHEASTWLLKFACMDFIMKEKHHGKLDLTPLLASPQILVEVANYKQFE